MGERLHETLLADVWAEALPWVAGGLGSVVDHVGTPAQRGSGDIHLRTLTFALDGDLEEAGRRFVGELLRPL